jgi:hypothetical protein
MLWWHGAVITTMRDIKSIWWWCMTTDGELIRRRGNDYSMILCVCFIVIEHGMHWQLVRVCRRGLCVCAAMTIVACDDDIDDDTWCVCIDDVKCVCMTHTLHPMAWSSKVFNVLFMTGVLTVCWPWQYWAYFCVRILWYYIIEIIDIIGSMTALCNSIKWLMLC